MLGNFFGLFTAVTHVFDDMRLDLPLLACLMLMLWKQRQEIVNDKLNFVSLLR
jgi:hypothetical protein